MADVANVGLAAMLFIVALVAVLWARARMIQRRRRRRSRLRINLVVKPPED